jgi:hypothetical protein
MTQEINDSTSHRSQNVRQIACNSSRIACERLATGNLVFCTSDRAAHDQKSTGFRAVQTQDHVSASNPGLRTRLYCPSIYSEISVRGQLTKVSQCAHSISKSTLDIHHEQEYPLIKETAV